MSHDAGALVAQLGTEPVGLESPFDPRSPGATAIAHLFIITLIVCAIIGVAVCGAIAYSLVAFRARKDAGEPPQATGNRWLEILWTLVPIGIVAWLLVMSAETMRKSDPGTDRAADIVVVGHQWWWEARYASGAVTANEIHIPAGRPVRLRLESADVIHDFWVPQLGRKLDVVPGHPNALWLEASSPGLYGGTCAEYCGAQHAWMRIAVIAQAPADFDAWQSRQLSPASTPPQGDPARGEQIFRDDACGNCHTIAGRGFKGAFAPDLTHVASRATLGAGVATNTPADLASWLRDPQSIKPGCHMPSFNLDPQRADALTAYLEGLR